MIKVIDEKNTIIVDFKNNSNMHMSGKLLTYEIFGEACILVDNVRIWVPFSRLTEKSKNRIFKSGILIQNGKKNKILKNPKAFIIVTIFVLMIYSYFY